MQPSIHKLIVSPQRDHIAYLRGTPTDLSLYVQSLDGGAAQPLVEHIRCSEPFMSMVWAKNGQHIYFARDDDNWFHDIWRIDLTNGAVEQITNYFHTNSYPVAMHPHVERLLVISNLRGELNLRLLHLQTYALRKITDYADPVKTAVYGPQGNKIAYTANATDNPHNTDVYIMGEDGFDKRKALSTLAGAFDIVRAWSANGRYLAVESNFEGGWRAGLYDLRTLSLHWLTPAWETAHALTFSPDSTRLLVRKAQDVRIYDVEKLTDKHINKDVDYVVQAAWINDTHIVYCTSLDKLFTYNTEQKIHTLLPG